MTLIASYARDGHVWIPGFEDRYSINPAGEIVSWLRKTPFVLKSTLDSNGYPGVKLYDAAGRTFSRKTHQFVALAFMGPRPNGMQVRHLDGDSRNPRLENLAYGTHAENMQDRTVHGGCVNANKTHCPQGHSYSGDNLMRSATQRRCRACNRASCARRAVAA